MTEFSKRGLPWLRIVEGAVIVSSILLAFGIDAWWDQTKEHALTQQHLAVLIAELSQTGTDIELGIAGTERSLGASMEILALMSGKNPSRHTRIRSIFRRSTSPA